MLSLNPSIEDLQPNVMADILSWLPDKKIIHCKCVCKNGRELVSDSYFVNLHLSRSPVGFMYHYSDLFYNVHDPGNLYWLEIKDDTRLHHDPVMSLPSFEYTEVGLVGSVNGLVCLGQWLDKTHITCICNPVTTEYTTLPSSQHSRLIQGVIVHGFGVGLLTKEYKVIRIFQRDIHTDSPPYLLEAEVYTLGKDQWRQLGHVPDPFKVSYGTFLNGCIHWIALEQDSLSKLYAFDIDNETFHLFPSPLSEKPGYKCYQSLGVLNGFVSQSDTSEFEFTIWVMREYRIKKSWNKEVVIKNSYLDNVNWLMNENWLMSAPATLIEGLEDGTIFMLFDAGELLVYCPREKRIKMIVRLDKYLTGIAYRPSFLKLQTFESESVHLLES